MKKFSIQIVGATLALLLLASCNHKDGTTPVTTPATTATTVEVVTTTTVATTTIPTTTPTTTPPSTPTTLSGDFPPLPNLPN